MLQMKRITLLVVMLLITLAAGAKNVGDSIGITVSLSWSSSVSLTKNDKGEFTGTLHLSTSEINQAKHFSTMVSIPTDTAAMLLQGILDLGLLELYEDGSHEKVIDGFKARFSINKPYDKKEFVLVPGLSKEQNSVKANQIIVYLRKALSADEQFLAYLNTLPSGTYTNGMTLVRVSELVPVGIKKSSLYLLHEKAFGMNRLHVPLYLVNKIMVEPNELNKYEVEDVINTQEIKGAMATALYGLKGAYGVILITTKK